jgi:hypothetical protein
MGKFACHCGYVISNSISPCPMSGELRWEPEVDWLGTEVQRVVADFLTAVENNQRESWIKNYFSDVYPLDLSLAMVIDDIYSKVYNEKGHSVYQCPECERLYLQKEFNTNEWTCFEKRN